MTLGLTEWEAKERLEKYGYNELKAKKRITWLNILIRQFVSNFLVWVLIVAMAISVIIGEIINFWMILFVIIFVIIMGFIQEYKAEKAMESLKKFVQYKTHVIREGRLKKIYSREVVPGDVLVLEMGDKIPADAKIIDTIGEFKVDESVLTGESKAIKKSKEDLIFAGTQIVRGKCNAYVIYTGMMTELGKIAGMIEKEEEKTPLQIKIHNLGRRLALIALLSSTVVFGFGIFMGAPITEMLMVALALAVATVPEGLPLTLTLTLSAGMHNMAKHNAVVRKMLAVETLGSTTVICTDKTGTLTKNEMTVEKIFIYDKIYEITAKKGYEPKGEFIIGNKNIEVNAHKNLVLLLKAVSLCNNAVIRKTDGMWETIGDPTEVALIVAGAKADLWKKDLEKRYPRIKEIAFSSERKLMTTVHKEDNGLIVFSKGAPEAILRKCKFIKKDNEIREINTDEIEKIIRMNKELASSSYRVLGVAYKKICGDYSHNNLKKESIEDDLIFLGLVGMTDPPREGVKEAIKTCKKAGIRVIMITGDNEETAKAVGKKIGLIDDNNDYNINKTSKKIMTGNELDILDEKEFESVVDVVEIYARVMPEQKLKIVKTLKRKGHIVAMTGDGVNDAPALKMADIGIAMGIKGTDVAKESSDMILQDDNFATIVEAVKSGRNIYENIEKFTCYLISHNFMQIILIAIGIFIFGFNYLPLLPLHILFINAVGEELPSISLGMDPVRKDVMNKPPRKIGQEILTKRNFFLVIKLASFMAFVTFIVFIISNPIVNIEYARTMVFTTMVGMVIVNTFNFRSLDESVFKIGAPMNKILILAVVFISIITLVILYTPYLRGIFEFTTLGLKDLTICLVASFSTFIYMEIVKLLNNKKTPKNKQ
ncbi:cation-translocating P-type ATPase [Methanothermococcus okinawensis]|uniref:ATPase, P-type (Transporting), HAD superfamily, subfamily IC n=1 Tax=Methanothermococcus okinawensis (strain DSM 14208 / JCM 11175 / IH1) TaxID=647113 RepID=F8AJN2_METOI|nr:cation-transporting P-type ATPase [Methanothermococcus okinawensis]AEH07222.1 ATPase, P-type (transporting), HAD superfamily, subfamily IC [Methanothermococcus okinawensis IH1]